MPVLAQADIVAVVAVSSVLISVGIPVIVPPAVVPVGEPCAIAFLVSEAYRTSEHLRTVRTGVVIPSAAVIPVVINKAVVVSGLFKSATVLEQTPVVPLLVLEPASSIRPAKISKVSLVLLLLPALVLPVRITSANLKTSLLSTVVNLVPRASPVARIIAIRSTVPSVAVPAVVIVVTSVTPVPIRLLLLPAAYIGLSLDLLPLTLITKLFRSPLSRTVPLYLLSLHGTLLGFPALVIPSALDLPLLLSSSLCSAVPLDLLSLHGSLLSFSSLVIPGSICPALLLLAALLRLTVLDLLSLPCAVLFRAIRVLTPDLPALLGAVLFRALLVLALFRLLAIAVLSASILLPESAVGRSYE